MSKKQSQYASRILSKVFLADDMLLLRFERLGRPFSAGQYLTLLGPGQRRRRDYSVFSSEKDLFFEVLISLNHGDEFCRFLRDIQVNDTLFFQGPFGKMKWQAPENLHVFCATGIGIAPFHAMVATQSNFNYQLVLQLSSENPYLPLDIFDNKRIIRCVWPGDGGDFSGHIVSYLRQNPFPAGTHFFLAGNYETMLEISQLLAVQGFSHSRVHSDIV